MIVNAAAISGPGEVTVLVQNLSAAPVDPTGAMFTVNWLDLTPPAP